MIRFSVITVAYNDAIGLASTIRSVITQNYDFIEYIVIDGGSTDGSVAILEDFSEKIDYWVSEPDSGIYNAMNKGLKAAHGDYVLFLNSSDEFINNEVLSNVADLMDMDSDVVYGSSIQINRDGKRILNKPMPLPCIEKYPIFRHNAAFFRLSLHRKYLFAEHRTKELGFSLDFEAIYRMYKSGAKFQEIDLVVMSHNMLGISTDTAQSLIYDYKITHDRFNLFDWVVLQLKVIKYRYINRGKSIY